MSALPRVIPHGAPQARKYGTHMHRSFRDAPRVWVPDSRCAASGMTLCSGAAT
jgi:hypothetical protein